MGKIIPFRPRRPAHGRFRGGGFRPAQAPRARKTTLGARWFPVALVALPLAAFSAVLLWPLGGGGPQAAAATGDREAARFAICSGPVRVSCVVDGDTIWYRGEKIRIADLDTPEVFSPGCANEEAMGRRATIRLQTLLNAGPFSLEPNPEGRAEDNYGRSLKLVTRGGESLGAVLVDEGLAEEWGGPRKRWC